MKERSSCRLENLESKLCFDFKREMFHKRALLATRVLRKMTPYAYLSTGYTMPKADPKKSLFDDDPEVFWRMIGSE